ncbi:MAG: hypothetical protein AAFY34_07235 [Pseudomonadota bacterium]
MSGILSMVSWDIRLQIRSHLYSATVFTTLALCLVAYLLAPLDISPKLLALLLFTDPAVIGLSFIGAFVLMERGGNTLIALATSPLESTQYVAGKLVSFSLLGTVSGGIVAVVASGGSLNIALLLIALLLSNIVAVLIGFAIAARTRSVNAFLAWMTIMLVVSVLPLMPYLSADPDYALLSLSIIPSFSMLTLLEAGFSGSDVGIIEFGVHTVYLLIWAVAGWIWAIREYDAQLRQYVG